MAYYEYCPKCDETVKCQEKKKKSFLGKLMRWIIQLFCPKCGLLLDTIELFD
jgi:ssDNA-binding Zn-finger/Zn-ribbon topoisomerase 1